MSGLPDIAPARVVQDCADGVVPAWVFDADEPVVLRNLVQAWPAVRDCDGTVESVARYLSNFWIDAPVTAYVGDAGMQGRFFYNEDFTGFNFKSGTATLPQVFQKIANPQREDQFESIYVGSTPVDKWLPGFRQRNDVSLPVDDALASFWLGTRTRISAHYDFPDNLACVVAGERRFTLFPPEQVGNLYVGPVDRTPSGQAISLVDFAAPDFDRYPRFADALAHARSCTLGPGDAIFIPSMWWHNVEATSPFNLLVNYWWCTSPPSMGSPSNALMHAILALRDLPPRQRAAWKGLFDHYVFEADEDVYAHIPEAGRGCLTKLDDDAARRLRAELLNRLNQ